MIDYDLSVLEIEALVGPMEPVPCEHLEHSLPQHFDSHGGNASHYVQSFCLCGRIGKVTAVCTPWINLVKSNAQMICPACMQNHPALTVVKILGPLNGSIS